MPRRWRIAHRPAVAPGDPAAISAAVRPAPLRNPQEHSTAGSSQPLNEHAHRNTQQHVPRVGGCLRGAARGPLAAGAKRRSAPCRSGSRTRTPGSCTPWQPPCLRQQARLPVCWRAWRARRAPLPRVPERVCAAGSRLPAAGNPAWWTGPACRATAAPARLTLACNKMQHLVRGHFAMESWDILGRACPEAAKCTSAGTGTVSAAQRSPAPHADCTQADEKLKRLPGSLSQPPLI